MKQYELFKDYLAKYEETKQQIADAESAEMDAQINYLDKKLEVVGKKRQIRMDVRDTEIQQFEKELKKLDNQAFVTAERIALLTKTMTALEDQVLTERNSAKAALLAGVYAIDENGNPIKDKKGNLRTLGTSQKYKDMNLDQLLSKLSQSSFWENHSITETAAESLKNTLDSLNGLDESLDEIKEKIDKQLIETFEHWQAVMERHLKTMEHLVNRSNIWLEILESVGKANLGWTSQQMNDYRQRVWDIQKKSAAADYKAYQSSFEQFKTAKEGYMTIADSKKAEAKAKEESAAAHGKKAVQYENKIDQLNGNYDYQTQMEENRAARKIVQDKMANPEKYYGDKNYFSTKKGKKEYASLQEEDQKLADAINAHKENIDYKRQVRAKLQQQIEEKEAKLKKTKNKEEQATLQKEIDSLKKRDKLYKDQIVNLKQQVEEYEKLKDAEIDLQVKDTELAEGLRSEIFALMEDYETMRDKVREQREQYLQDLLDLIQQAKENLSKYLDDIMKDFEKKVSGVYGNIEGMQTAFDQNKQIAERYLQDTEKIYELTKLNRDLEKKMDETSNVKAKEKLAKFQKQITDYAAEGVKMSEYDLEVLQKQYDLQVAKIALEEAQDAKTQVRLTRDAEGNYSYTYTADESKTAEAEQNYEDKLNDLIKYNNEYQLQMQEMILATEAAEEEAINKLRQAWENGDITLEQFYQQAEQAHAFYKSQMQYYAQENEKASENSMYAFVTEYDAYYSTTDKKIKVNQTFSDDTRKTYEQVHQIYKDAAITRDAALYEEEVSYRNHQLELARQLKAGEITQEKYDQQMEQYAKDHSAALDQINTDYTNAVAKQVTLQNGTRLGASNYFRSLILGDSETNTEVLGNIEAANKGFILNTETEYLPGLGKVYESATSTVEDFANAVTDGDGDNTNTTLLGQMKQGMQDYEDNVKAAEEAVELILSDADDPYDTLAEAAVADMEDIENQADETSKKIDTAVADSEKDMEQAVTDVKDWYEKSKSYWNKAKKKIDKITTAITEMLAAASGIKPIKVDVDTEDAVKNVKALKKAYEALGKAQQETVTDPPKTQPTKPSGSEGTQGDGKLQVGDKVTLLDKGYENSFEGGRRIMDSYVGKTVVIDKMSSNQVSGGQYTGKVGKAYIHVSTTAGGDLGWVRMDQIKGFDTGGYTGKWGSDGRWALLHQKELVLNAEDTENMLAAVKTVRQIAEMVDLQAQQASLAGQYALAIGSIQASKSAALDQNVHITAEFPNVQDHIEIETALTSLVNRASQYAWRQ